ncbi:protein CURVATURE THYLAKOID 1C, chloroplastic-like [Selaginella moellendorffii]|uniref:protein CURVATURE THYLAKOID 1C, chloroplastic-like n=1 Tax=Selaginella moellendorffii TaxID=88036 RepID=UPI000D1C236C|nr:protein CURVATURE THYLAKOID 1C, chloroplastic-like [Selaginella moellendorffii]|eukprot:XP_024515207.1 protein CURVATURE THYLAKOID 1C, chloroplastic-like [Selaginella moellendorffii]
MACSSSATCVINSARAAPGEGFRNSHCVPAALRPGLGSSSLPSLSSGKISSRTLELRTPSRMVAFATETSSTEAAANDFLKKIQDTWEKTDDKLAVGGLGFAALLVLWASTGLIAAIDKLPILPTFFELVGLLFSSWFVYRYLLFKPDREELLKKIDETKGKITGSD